MRFPVDQIWIDNDAANASLTREIVKKLPSAKVFQGDALREKSRLLELEPDPLSSGKRILKLVKHKGAFVKPCPGTRQYLCCGLEILHIGQGCPMDCRYCALQVYFNRPYLEAFVNAEDMLTDLDRHLAEDPRFHRICTGEFADSLALDPLTGLSPRLVDFFSCRTDASLEIKTKTDFVEPLLGKNPNGRVILAFSMNAEPITRSEERKAVSLDRRIRAASRAADAGYRLAFHFDPIIPVPGWERSYADTVDRIFAAVKASAIVWISLGVLRFVPELKEVVTGRFGPVPYFHEAFLRGLDGKSRFQADRRIKIYRSLSKQIWARSPEARIYLCMESPYIWEQALGIRMPDNRAFAEYLDAAIIPSKH